MFMHTHTHYNWRLEHPFVDDVSDRSTAVFITYGHDFTNAHAQCYPGNRCDMMLQDGVHHRYCIRNNPDQPAEQVRIEDPVLRSRIPRGVYRHFRGKRSKPYRSESRSS